MSGKLVSAMSSLVELFECYALKDGDRLHLSRREMSNMFHEELGDLIQRSKDPQKTGEILTNMDQNLDGQVDFEEFVSMTVQDAVMNSRSLEGGVQKAPVPSSACDWPRGGSSVVSVHGVVEDMD
ncbi:protein S100-A1-like [Morone saxatilis]|uniref:protein S100-A1-like n=1 Tax=Morone saxatilis TaxID=34816 RepID=UPI0015E2111E|nr:protein S100-A1-like [Morone saxatilis]